MNADTAHTLLAYFGIFGLGGVSTLLILWVFYRSYLSNYLSKKGENLATREGVAAITHEIEGVKTQYALLVEDGRAKHQLRMAALDKRLQAHQEAFALWRELFSSVHTEAVGATVIKCQSWWESNCLYLEPRVRDAFLNAYSAGMTHRAYIQGRHDAEVVTKNWERITTFPDVLFEAIKLPPFPKEQAELLMNQKRID